MIVDFPENCAPYDIFRWFEKNIGLYGRGWKIVYRERPDGMTVFHKLEIDKVEDALAYKLTFNV